jgi:hypothetical protein
MGLGNRVVLPMGIRPFMRTGRGKNNEKRHKFCLSFMACIVPPLPEMVKNEAFG